MTVPDRQAAALVPVFKVGMRAANRGALQYEAERLNTVPDSPVVRTMRAIVEAETARRQAGGRPRGGEGGS